MRSENRLVASSLETDWNMALRTLEQTQLACEQQRDRDSLLITPEIRARVMALTSDFPAVWRDPRTTDRDRKRLLRLLIEDVTILKAGQAITLQVRFRGGSSQTLRVPAPLRCWQVWITQPEIVAAIDQLLNDFTESQVAKVLNQLGLHPSEGGSLQRHDRHPFAQSVWAHRLVYAIANTRPIDRPGDRGQTERDAADH